MVPRWQKSHLKLFLSLFVFSPLTALASANQDVLPAPIHFFFWEYPLLWDHSQRDCLMFFFFFLLLHKSALFQIYDNRAPQPRWNEHPNRNIWAKKQMQMRKIWNYNLPVNELHAGELLSSPSLHNEFCSSKSWNTSTIRNKNINTHAAWKYRKYK